MKYFKKVKLCTFVHSTLQYKGFTVGEKEEIIKLAVVNLNSKNKVILKNLVEDAKSNERLHELDLSFILKQPKHAPELTLEDAEALMQDIIDTFDEVKTTSSKLYY